MADVFLGWVYNQDMSAKNTPPPIELDELLAAEFEYIAQTATQANEDRARVSSFYLIAVGSLVAALFSTQLFDLDKFTQTVKFMFGGIFILLTLLGISTIMQLARLRTAWYESMLAMNQIKDFAMQQNPELTRAFRWTSQTLPPKYKKNSVSYYQALEVALIGGLMFIGDDSGAGNVHTMPGGQTMTGMMMMDTGSMHTMPGGGQMPGMTHTAP